MADLAHYLAHQESEGELYNGDTRTIWPLLVERARDEGRLHVADAAITDPPFGVGLVTRKARDSKGNGNHDIAPASTVYQDDPDYVAGLIREVVPQVLAHVGRAAIFSGFAMVWNYPQADCIGSVYIPAATSYTPWGFGVSQPILYYGKDPKMQDGRGRYPNGFVWRGGKQETFDHPCPKPLPWMTWAVERASRPGETVADVFAGTGTTLVAAKQCGRKYLGVEIEPKYCAIAVSRLGQNALALDYGGDI